MLSPYGKIALDITVRYDENRRILGEILGIRQYIHSRLQDRSATTFDSHPSGNILRCQIPGIIGIRIPSNREALELLRFVKKPLLVPSANKADQKPALSVEEVKAIFKDEINIIVPGEIGSGEPSTIIDLTGHEIKLIRKGPISLEELNLAIN